MYAVRSADPVLIMDSLINITCHVLEVNLISCLQEVRGDFHDIVINKLEKDHALVTYLCICFHHQISLTCSIVDLE